MKFMWNNPKTTPLESEAARSPSPKCRKKRGIRRSELEAEPAAGQALVAAARYLTAQKLRRGIFWSTKNALTLARGEGLHTG